MSNMSMNSVRKAPLIAVRRFASTSALATDFSTADSYVAMAIPP
jgi:hypothetical protein